MAAIEINEALKQIPILELQIQLRPTSGVCGALAANLFTADRTEEALPFALKSFEKTPSQIFAMNLGLIYKDLGMHKESFKIMEYAAMLDGTDPYVQLGYAESLLRAGFWNRAWPIYDNTRATQSGAALEYALPASVKEWQGEDLGPGHLLFVLPEGGMGDRICYPRFLQVLTERGINWKFIPHTDLRGFFERLYPADKLANYGDQMEPTHWVTAFALPAKLLTTPHTIPPPLKLTASPEMIQKYNVGRPDDLPVVGLCYQAGEALQGGRRVRSLTEGQAMRLVCMTGDKVRWVSLQHKQKMPYPVLNVPMDTWEEYAGLIHHLDAVVTVDTGVMHLAGSMGKPMCVLLPGNSCWKFLASGPKCPWYPTSRLFRNGTRGFENAITELTAHIRNTPALQPLNHIP